MRTNTVNILLNPIFVKDKKAGLDNYLVKENARTFPIMHEEITSVQCIPSFESLRNMLHGNKSQKTI